MTRVPAFIHTFYCLDASVAYPPPPTLRIPAVKTVMAVDWATNVAPKSLPPALDYIEVALIGMFEGVAIYA